jgi:hypothetical protein
VFASVFGDFLKIEMSDLKEQVVWVKFCFLLGKTAAETVTLLKEACKDEAMCKTQVYEWFIHFKRGEMSAEDQLSCGRPYTSRNDETVEKVRQAVLADRHWTINKISEITGVS